MILLLGGCITYDIRYSTDKPAFDTGTSPDSESPPVDSDSPPPPPEEECNGEDDDGDGATDEGFADEDANGVADCLEYECPPLQLGVAGVATEDERCEGTAEPVADPWDVNVKWAIDEASNGFSGSLASPVVGPLYDDDGDGDVDGDDDAYVVLPMFRGTGFAGVAVFDAAGQEVWVKTDLGGLWVHTLADIDADGSPDILSWSEIEEIRALEADGTLKWTGPDLYAVLPGVTPVDLEGDGEPEVLVGEYVLDGATGAVELRLPSPGWGYGSSVALDFEGDGLQEIFWNGALYDRDGTERWDSGVRSDTVLWPAVVQADADDDPEFVLVGDYYYTLLDSDGTVLVSQWVLNKWVAGPPCVADFDGDGAEEVAWAYNFELVLRELDGTEIWSVPADDWGLASCSGFDLDGSGVPEVLYRDQSSFRILDGATGAVLYEDDTVGSGTGTEFPVVTDLDRDGHAEVLYTGDDTLNPSTHALTVLEHGGDGWAPADGGWVLQEYAVTNQSVDGTVPTEAPPYWLTNKVYRARNTSIRPNLRIEITDVCVADCTYGPVELAVWVENTGGLDVAAGREVGIYALDSGVERLVSTITLPEVPANTALDGIQVSLTPADLGADGLRARITRGRVGLDCDTTDDVDDWSGVACE